MRPHTRDIPAEYQHILILRYTHTHTPVQYNATNEKATDEHPTCQVLNYKQSMFVFHHNREMSTKVRMKDRSGATDVSTLTTTAQSVRISPNQSSNSDFNYLYIVLR